MSPATEFLFTQFQLRKRKNPRYSQGSFARLLGINSGRVAQYFSGKRAITAKAAVKISEKLGLDSGQQEYFVELCRLGKKKTKLSPPNLLSPDQIAFTVEWYHFAILQLTLTEDFKYDSEWIAHRLNIPQPLVDFSLDRLLRLGLLKVENNQAAMAHRPLMTTMDVPNRYIQMGHQDILDYVSKTLPEVPIEKRDLSSITVAIDKKNILRAKKMIQNFRRRLATSLTKGHRDEVYTLNIQLFPLTHEVPHV